MIEMSGNIGIREFFNGKNVLISGVTGFVGKVLLEKIIRTVPEFGRIYLLIRKKANQSL